jgi:hypothetical protein
VDVQTHVSRYTAGAGAIARDSNAIEPREKLGIVRIQRAHASVHDGLDLNCIDGAVGLCFLPSVGLNGLNGLNALNGGGALNFLPSVGLDGGRMPHSSF